MTTATPALNLLVHWGFTDPHGRQADAPWMHEELRACLDIGDEVRREYALAEADPAFVTLSFDFCRVATRMTYTLTLRREAFSADSLTWLGYRQADGSYRREGE